MNQKKIRILLLFLIISAGFFLRLYQLDKESIWFDEAITLERISDTNVNQIIDSVYEGEAKPPLDFIMLHFWSKLFGLSAFALRFYYLIFGVLSIPLIYLLGKEIFNYKVGLLSSLLLSISVVNILYSQEMRTYSIFTFLTILSYLFYTKLLKQSKSNKNYIYLTIINSITNSIHYFGIINMAIQNLIVLVLYKNKKIEIKKWIFAQIIPSLVFLYFIRYSLPLLTRFHYGIQGTLITRFHIPLFIAQLGFGFFILGLLGLLAISFIIFNYSEQLIKIYKKINKSIIIPIIVIIWLIGTIITLNILISPSFITRYSLFLTPIFYILISKGISDIKIKKLQSILLIIILLISSFSLYSYYSKPTKEQWKEVAQYIEKKGKSSEIILFDYKSINLSFNIYYNGILEQKGLSEKKDSNIQEIMKSKSGAWLVISHNRRTQDFYKKQMDNDYTLEFEKQFKGVKLYYYSVDMGETKCTY